MTCYSNSRRRMNWRDNIEEIYVLISEFYALFFNTILLFYVNQEMYSKMSSKMEKSSNTLGPRGFGRITGRGSRGS